MANRENPRLGRINEELKKQISHIIMYDLKNPNVTGLISVTEAKVTPDLKYAKVFVSILNANNTQESLVNLKKSAGFIRTEVAKSMNLRITPEIIFELDSSLEYGAKMDKIIDEVMKKDKGE